jgi:preprotein translocase YajC subunit
MEPAAAQGSASMFWLILLACMFVGLFWLPARAQKKQAQQLLDKVNALQKGDQVILPNQIIGTIVGFKDNALEVKIAESVKITILKTAIIGTLKDDSAAQQGGTK